MTKKLILFCLSFTLAAALCAQVLEPLRVDETRPSMKTDTIIDGKRIFLTRTFYFGKDTLVVETGYRYLNPKDFSFYYQELEEKVVVSLNSNVLKTENENHKPQVHAYPSNPLMGERITVNATDYLLLLGREFYCEGSDCPNVYCLVVNTQTGVCLDINTGFCNEKDIFKIINKRSAENDNVQVPVLNDCKQSHSEAKFVNVDKAL